MTNHNPKLRNTADMPLEIATKAIEAAKKKRIESKKRKDAIDILEDQYADITLAIESLNMALTSKGDKPVKREGGGSAPDFWQEFWREMFGSKEN